jgi:hypothetical protein
MKYGDVPRLDRRPRPQRRITPTFKSSGAPWFWPLGGVAAGQPPALGRSRNEGLADPIPGGAS